MVCTFLSSATTINEFAKLTPALPLFTTISMTGAPYFVQASTHTVSVAAGRHLDHHAGLLAGRTDGRYLDGFLSHLLSFPATLNLRFRQLNA